MKIVQSVSSVLILLTLPSQVRGEIPGQNLDRPPLVVESEGIRICQPIEIDDDRTSIVEALDWQCRDKSHLLRIVQGYQVALGAMTAICAFPGPAQVAVPLYGLGQATLAVSYFYISGLPCDEPKPELTSEQIEKIEAGVCAMMGKKYQRGLGPSERSSCY